MTQTKKATGRPGSGKAAVSKKSLSCELIKLISYWNSQMISNFQQRNNSPSNQPSSERL